ncbi:MAG: glycosyltransferase family 4 protein [Vicinamibacterales bacterium]|nr:glycosyltransferase family 4 protein [Vicinamibacterales bacterium]
MAEQPFRVTFVLTHPSQYMAPWFRDMAATRDDVVVSVLYGTEPTPEAQAAGFGGAFAWDVPLREGYTSRVLSPALASLDLHADGFSRVDAPGLGDAIAETRPDAVVVPGWHAAIYLRAMAECQARGVPAIYRGDSTLLSGPGGWRRPLWRVHTRRRLHRYDAWLAVGAHARDYLASFGVPEPLVFASPHAVDNARFAGAAGVAQVPERRAAVRAAFGIAADARVVLFAGKLSSHKRPRDLIRAAARTSRPVHLLFAGAGPDEAACRALAAEAGVAASFAGFLNQSRMPEAFAAADCLALPSVSETWGLVVNEALASGVPCVVSDGVGCAPDLIDGTQTGRVVPRGDLDALARALDDTLEAALAGPAVAEACRARAEGFTFRHASDGVVAACARLRRRADAPRLNATRHPRILACCGNMVIPGGLERMTFRALGACQAQGAAVHAIVNGWESARIVALAEEAGASWSTGRYWEPFRRPSSPGTVLAIAADIVRTSTGLLRDARRFRPTHVLVPEWVAVLRNAPALVWLRLGGCRVVMRLGNAPADARRHAALWRWAIGPLVDQFVANSQFIAGEVAATGIDRGRIEVVPNAVARVPPATMPARDPARVIFVGQIIPPKGADLLLEAVALVAAAGLPVTVEIVGEMDGWESPPWAGHRAALLARAAQPDLAGRVTFSGHRDDVVARLAGAAVHCCPSRPEQREGMAGVVLEAKLAGVPSVVTPTGSLPELVQHGVDGWIARDASAEAIAEGLRHFLTDGAARERAGAAARASLDRFSQARFAVNWARVFGMAPRAGAPAPPVEVRAS